MYIKTGYRSIRKNKVSSIVNIGGLTIGMAVAMLIGLWVYDELSFNKYHENYDRIGRVLIKGNDAKHGTFISNSLPYPLATEMLTNYKSNFKYVVRASWIENYIVAAGDKKLSRPGQFMDPDAAHLFTLKMIRGSRDGLKDMHSVLLAAATAKSLFGDSDPLNQFVTLNNKLTVRVTGVYEDLPMNAQLSEIEFISTWDLWASQNLWIAKRAATDWMNHFLRIYVEIPANSSFETVNHNIAEAELINIRNIEKYKEHADRNPTVFLNPMSNWHFNAHLKGRGEDDNGPLRMVWLVGTIGAFVLLLACINFMNLSTARSEKRARETGIRKAIGSLRSQLIWQFFCESLLVVIIAFMLATLLVALTLPWFNTLAAKEMIMPFGDAYFWMYCGLFMLLTAFLAGSYPAIYLSSFKPVKVLKGTFRAGRFAAIPRKALVVAQFTVSVALIICTVVVYRQLQHAKDRPVGYTREGLITLEKRGEDFNGKHELIRNTLLQTGVVAEVSQSMGKVTEVASGNNEFDWKGRDTNKDESFGTLAITSEHGKTIGWEILAGRDFSGTIAGDSNGIVINEATAKYMALENPVGETVTWNFRGTTRAYTILGVVRDMVMESPYKPVDPTIFFIKAPNGGTNFINIRVHPNVAMSAALPKIEAVFKKLVPSAPFDYQYVDLDYAQKFAAEERIGNLAWFFAAFAIFISCLGLFGLSTFTAEQRVKEIGVRKVLGASVKDIWRLLSKEFVMLVSISMIVAFPLAWYFMNAWLQDYIYRTNLSWTIFASAGGCALLITLLTVSFQAIKAALANPTRALRSE